VTGITKYVQSGLSPAFNNATDISLNPLFGAMMGFTDKEVRLYFKDQIKKSAKTLSISSESLLDQIKNCYNGFCFDGKTLVYNPDSLALFFLNNEFDNY
jgi:hypothetical protein